MSFFFFRGAAYNEAHVAAVYGSYDGRTDSFGIAVTFSDGTVSRMGNCTVEEFLGTLTTLPDPKVFGAPEAKPRPVATPWHKPEAIPDLGDNVLLAQRTGPAPWDWNYTPHVFVGVWPDSVTATGPFKWMLIPGGGCTE